MDVQLRPSARRLIWPPSPRPRTRTTTTRGRQRRGWGRRGQGGRPSRGGSRCLVGPRSSYRRGRSRRRRREEEEVEVGSNHGDGDAGDGYSEVDDEEEVEEDVEEEGEGGAVGEGQCDGLRPKVDAERVEEGRREGRGQGWRKECSFGRWRRFSAPARTILGCSSCSARPRRSRGRSRGRGRRWQRLLLGVARRSETWGRGKRSRKRKKKNIIKITSLSFSDGMMVFCRTWCGKDVFPLYWERKPNLFRAKAEAIRTLSRPLSCKEIINLTCLSDKKQYFQRNSIVGLPRKGIKGIQALNLRQIPMPQSLVLKMTQPRLKRLFPSAVGSQLASADLGPRSTPEPIILETATSTSEVCHHSPSISDGSSEGNVGSSVFSQGDQTLPTKETCPPPLPKNFVTPSVLAEGTTSQVGEGGVSFSGQHIVLPPPSSKITIGFSQCCQWFTTAQKINKLEQNCF
ncbi:hypothetical protein Fmac_003299 [Flemingia macrophylla]|uniref:Uncharacterized protein n=1 Tax=Flemingia macrophylla TaxID=520843 RepID=A0ABD1NMF9_9FABA